MRRESEKNPKCHFRINSIVNNEKKPKLQSLTANCERLAVQKSSRKTSKKVIWKWTKNAKLEQATKNRKLFNWHGAKLFWKLHKRVSPASCRFVARKVYIVSLISSLIDFPFSRQPSVIEYQLSMATTVGRNELFSCVKRPNGSLNRKRRKKIVGNNFCSSESHGECKQWLRKCFICDTATWCPELNVNAIDSKWNVNFALNKFWEWFWCERQLIVVLVDVYLIMTDNLYFGGAICDVSCVHDDQRNVFFLSFDSDNVRWCWNVTWKKFKNSALMMLSADFPSDPQGDLERVRLHVVACGRRRRKTKTSASQCAMCLETCWASFSFGE